MASYYYVFTVNECDEYVQLSIGMSKRNATIYKSMKERTTQDKYYLFKKINENTTDIRKP